MEVDTSRQTKRKRSPESSNIPAKKRKAAYLVSSAKGEPGRDREQVRDEARSLYKAYDVLVRTGTAAASLEKRRSSLGALFKAVEGGCLAGKRLAARIIPRFMGSFPEELSKAVDCLLDLVMATPTETQNQQQHRMLLEGLRRDALEGIKRACDQAVEKLEKPEQLLGRVVHCLLRQVGRPHFASQHGLGSNGVSASQSECGLMLSSIGKAFRKAPREVIMECLHAWRDGDSLTGPGAGATIVFEKLLLAECKGGSEVDYNSQRYAYSNGSGTCLAVDVLLKHYETAQWLGQTFYGIMQGAGSSPRSYHALLETLMQKLPLPMQESFLRTEDAQHMTLHNSRHAAYHVPSPNHSMHLKPRTPQSCMPPRQESESTHASHWDRETVQYLPTTVLPPHDDGPCVWFAVMPQHVRKDTLGEFCTKYGHVTSVIFPPAPCHEKAIVVFKSPRQASICCHHILGSRGLSGGHRICATVPAAGNPCRSRDPISTCIWVGGTPNQKREQEIVNAVTNANLPLPRHMIVINGGHNCPGYVLELQLLRLVSQTLECLEPIDLQHYEPDIPPPAPPSLPQIDMPNRPGHSKSQDKAWKMSRDQQSTTLPPGTWGSRSGDLAGLGALHFPPPPPLPYPSHAYHGTHAKQSGHQPSTVLSASESNRNNWRASEADSVERSSHVSSSRASRRLTSSPRRPQWSGLLAKSGDKLCKLVCWESPNLLRYSGTAQEPREWPDVLDVRLRVDLNTALKSVETPGDRSLLYLSPADSHNDMEGLKGFIQYLMDRMRAGVVQLKGEGRKGPDRVLYLIPPTRAVAKALDIDIGSDSTLIVLVIPEVGQTTKSRK